MCINASSSTVLSTPKLETTERSTSCKMGKSLVVYPHNKVLHSKEKERTTDTVNSMDESQQHDTECRKPDTKEYVLCDCCLIT